MTRAAAFRLSPPRPPANPAMIVATVATACAAVLALPAGPGSAGLWTLLAVAFPDSAQSCLALGWAVFAGVLGWLAADAVANRRIARPALTAALAAALLAPVGLAAPLWAALLAAAGMLAAPAPARPQAANDNQPPERLSGNPFGLAA